MWCRHVPEYDRSNVDIKLLRVSRGNLCSNDKFEFMYELFSGDLPGKLRRDKLFELYCRHLFGGRS